MKKETETYIAEALCLLSVAWVFVPILAFVARISWQLIKLAWAAGGFGW